MYLEIIFGKNKEQTTRQLQFKFDPFPTESATICLFHQRWIKTFYTQPFCQLCIKHDLIFYKIDWVHFCNNYLVGHSQKTYVWALGKWKMNFPCKENEKFRSNIVWNSKMYPCAQYEIIWKNYAMNVAIRLIIWLESHESSRLIARFGEHLFKIIAVLQVYNFCW